MSITLPQAVRRTGLRAASTVMPVFGGLTAAEASHGLPEGRQGAAFRARQAFWRHAFVQ